MPRKKGVYYKHIVSIVVYIVGANLSCACVNLAIKNAPGCILLPGVVTPTFKKALCVCAHTHLSIGVCKHT
jgi:hypothetical protein